MPLLNLLILFQLTCSLAFISPSASARGNIIGSLVIGTCMISALILLLHFLYKYFQLLHIKWPFIQSIQVFYILPFVFFCLNFVDIIYPTVAPLISLLILSTFFILFSLILFILLYGYRQSRIPQIKLLFFSLILPFLPFVLFFVVPEIFKKEPLLSGEVSALFLLLIPLNFCSFNYQNDFLIYNII